MPRMMGPIAAASLNRLPNLLVPIFFVAWLAMAAYGVFAYLTLEPTGSGFTRGSNRISAFLGWQVGALVVAIAGFAIGRRGRFGTAMRLLYRVPIWASGGMFLLLVVVVLGLFAYTSFTGS